MASSSANFFAIVHSDLTLGVHAARVFLAWLTRNAAQEELHV